MGSLFSPGIKSSSSLNDQQTQLLQALLPHYLKGMESGVTPYAGKLNAPYKNPFQQGEYNALGSYLSGKPSYDLSDQTLKDKYEKGVVAPGMATYQREVVPRLNEAFANVGGISSRLGTAKQQTLEGMQTNWQANLANMLYGNEQARAGLAESAAGRQGQGIGMAEGMAASRYGYAQAPLQAAYSEFLRTSPQNNPYFGLATQALGIPMITQQSTPSPFQDFSSMMGLGMQGALTYKLLGMK